jgi:hypothetical protein
MEPLNLIYWIKLGLGALAAIICVALRVNDIFTGILMSAAVYLLGDRILKQMFAAKVDKLSSITKTGISIYIVSWIFFWILLYTLFHIYV